VVCDDCRFPNEADLIRSLGGELWRVDREAATPSLSGHRSDGGLDDYTGFDARIDNNGALLELYSRLCDRLSTQEVSRAN
jgi:hypothetical protein